MPSTPIPRAPAAWQVRTTHAPATATLAARVHVSPHERGGERIEVSLRNASAGDVTLDAVTVEGPWLPADAPPGPVAGGGTTMATWPTQVRDGMDPANPIESGLWLMARRPDGYALAGFLTWRRFWSRLRPRDGGLTMTVDGEGRRIRPGEEVPLESLWLTQGPDWHDLLTGYADEIARARGGLRRERPDFTGWSTWDYYGRGWDEAAVRENLTELVRVAPGATLLQVDGGWWPARGDYTEVRASLGPDGMRRLARQVREHGLTAGIHFDGVRGDTSARVAREHPEYFLHDDRGAMISVPQLNDGDRLEHIYFDFSHPGARDYMSRVVRKLRGEWGYDYLKIDFLTFGLAEDIRARALRNDPARRIAPHDPGLTSVERLHLALQVWREAMGSDAFFLACSAPFGVVLGYADGLRTGYDVFPQFGPLRQCAQATAGSFYLHGRAAWTDTDYQVGRGPEDEDATRVRNEEKRSTLTLAEAEMWAIHVGLFGGTRLNSDKLTRLQPERLELFRTTLRLPNCRRYVPLDFWERGRSRDDAYHAILGEAAGRCYLGLFNWGSHDETVRLGSPAMAGLRLLAGGAEVSAGSGGLQVRLAARRAIALELPAGSDYDRLRRTLNPQFS